MLLKHGEELKDHANVAIFSATGEIQLSSAHWIALNVEDTFQTIEQCGYVRLIACNGSSWEDPATRPLITSFGHKPGNSSFKYEFYKPDWFNAKVGRGHCCPAEGSSFQHDQSTSLTQKNSEERPEP